MKATTFITVLALGFSGSLSCLAAEREVAAPGFRPESELANTFSRGIKRSKVAVFPTVIRTFEGITYSEASQKQIRRFLEDRSFGATLHSNLKIDLSGAEGKYQFALFKSGMESFRRQMHDPNAPDADYYLLVEILVTPFRNGGMGAGGLHCYILDGKGGNAFSFLLNSHHEIFVDANLKTDDTSSIGMASLVLKGTTAIMSALEIQILGEQQCGRHR